ncbi:MAG: hypothetical protein ACM3WV_02820 [Bacillota bacterium]
MDTIASNAFRQIKNRNSVAFGFKIEGNTGIILFQASRIPRANRFRDMSALRRILLG